MIERRRVLQGVTGLGAAGLAAGVGPAPAQAAEGAMTQTERNKRIVRAPYEAAQRQAVPGTLPNAKEEAPVHKADPSTVISHQDAPGGVDNPGATIAAIAGWHAQSMGPGVTSYGPMIAEGDLVVEEWETYFHGSDGTMYSNQYCWVKRITGDKVVQVREYLDSHHAFIVLGLHAPWKDLPPNRAPRRRWVPMKPPTAAGPLTAMETVFEIRQAFDLDPRLLRDPAPGAPAPKAHPDTPAGNKAVVQAMRAAQARGNAAEVSAWHAPGFRHFIAGEGPLGWNHLPLQDLYAPLVKHLASPISVRFGPMVAEGGAVFEEMDVLARLDDGTVYNNWHCFIHEVRGGQIVQTREYLDTHHLWVMLGRWADWGRTPVPALRKARRSNLPVVTATYQGRNPFLTLERWNPLPPVA